MVWNCCCMLVLLGQAAAGAIADTKKPRPNGRGYCLLSGFTFDQGAQDRPRMRSDLRFSLLIMRDAMAWIFAKTSMQSQRSLKKQTGWRRHRSN